MLQDSGTESDDRQRDVLIHHLIHYDQLIDADSA